MSPLLAALALQRVPGIGRRAQHHTLTALGGLTALCAADDRQLLATGLNREAVSAFRAQLDAGSPDDIAWLEADSHHILHLDDPRYPAPLCALDDAPLTLWAVGDLDLLSPPAIAMVGSRNPTAGGTETAHAFATDLAARGLVVASGLAAGIDAAAHRGALAAQGMTIAVIGTGADRVYPAANRELAHEIARDGLLLSEFALGTAPHPSHFPQRNRLISALSAGVLVVEAAVRSGSLITARLAGEQGRAVMAIPGSIHNPMARGCHRLIRDGAKLVESTNDVLEEIGGQLAPAETAPQADPHRRADTESSATESGELPAAHRALLTCVGHDPVSVDQLVERSGEPVGHVSSVLLMLELSGHLNRDADGRFSRAAKSDST